MADYIPSESLAREAMKLTCEKHPQLTFQQVVIMMRDAEWSFEDGKAKCTVVVPPEIPDMIEINIAPPDDQS